MLKNIAVKYPWVFVVAAFVVIIGAWTTLIQLAWKNAPQVIEVKKQKPEDR